MVTQTNNLVLTLDGLFGLVDQASDELACERPGRYLWLKFPGAKPKGKPFSGGIGFVTRDILCVSLSRDANEHVSMIEFERIVAGHDDPNATGVAYWNQFSDIVARTHPTAVRLVVMLDSEVGNVIGRYHTCSNAEIVVRGEAPHYDTNGDRGCDIICSIEIELQPSE